MIDLFFGAILLLASSVRHNSNYGNVSMQRLATQSFQRTHCHNHVHHNWDPTNHDPRNLWINLWMAEQESIYQHYIKNLYTWWTKIQSRQWAVVQIACNPALLYIYIKAGRVQWYLLHPLYAMQRKSWCVLFAPSSKHKTASWILQLLFCSSCRSMHIHTPVYTIQYIYCAAIAQNELYSPSAVCQCRHWVHRSTVLQ